MAGIVTQQELESLISNWLALHERQARAYPPVVLAHEILKLVELRLDLDERKKVRVE